MNGLDTVDSLLVEVNGSKVANFTVLLTLSTIFGAPILSKYCYVIMTKKVAKLHKACQNISTSVGMTKKVAKLRKCW